MIGVAQASSVLFKKEDVAWLFCLLGSDSARFELAEGKGFRCGIGNVVFVAGIMLGAKLTSHRFSAVSEINNHVSVPTALAGGF